MQFEQINIDNFVFKLHQIDADADPLARMAAVREITCYMFNNVIQNKILEET